MTAKQKLFTQASYIRSRLAKKAAVEKILSECEKRFPKGKVTPGYIRWIAKRSKGSRATK